jgi:hypothetical protein
LKCRIRKFSTVGNSFKGILFAIVLFIAGTFTLWWNEGRTVRTGDAIQEARFSCVEMSDITKVDSGLSGKLVHAMGRAETKGILKDSTFGIETNAIGGAEPLNVNIPQEEIDAFNKQIGGATGNTGPAISGSVMNYTPASQAQGQSVGYLHIQSDTVYLGRNPSNPAIGDVRVTFVHVPPKDISVIAVVKGDTFDQFTASNKDQILQNFNGQRQRRRYVRRGGERQQNNGVDSPRR